MLAALVHENNPACGAIRSNRNLDRPQQRADLVALCGHEPSDAAIAAHIERTQAEWIEAERHREIVEPTRQGAAVATAAVLTVSEAADCLRCSERTVVRMINRGSLKVSKSTGRTLVRRADLERLLER
jgi:excisionase family DNA binding protein